LIRFYNPEFKKFVIGKLGQHIQSCVTNECGIDDETLREFLTKDFYYQHGAECYIWKVEFNLEMETVTAHFQEIPEDQEMPADLEALVVIHPAGSSKTVPMPEWIKQFLAQFVI